MGHGRAYEKTKSLGFSKAAEKDLEQNRPHHTVVAHLLFKLSFCISTAFKKGMVRQPNHNNELMVSFNTGSVVTTLAIDDSLCCMFDCLLMSVHFTLSIKLIKGHIL